MPFAANKIQQFLKYKIAACDHLKIGKITISEEPIGSISMKFCVLIHNAPPPDSIRYKVVFRYRLHIIAVLEN